MKKILFYINSMVTGGAERVLVNLANQFAEEGYVVCIVTSLAVREYEINPQIMHIVLDRREHGFFTKNCLRIFRLGKHVGNFKPDVIVSFTLEASVRAILVAKFMRLKCIVSVRNAPQVIFRGFRGWTARMLYRLPDLIICQTEGAKQFFSDELQKKSVVIPNMLNPQFIQVPCCRRRDHRIVSVGRLSKQKNQRLLILAFADAVRAGLGWNLEIYGTGDEEQELQRLVEERKISERVRFCGVVKNLNEKIRDAGLFVLSSDYEGVPNALMEAMAEGLPVIATDCIGGGARELIRHGVNGLLVERGNVEDLGRAIFYMCNHAAEAEKMGEEARKIGEELAPEKIFSLWRRYVGE